MAFKPAAKSASAKPPKAFAKDRDLDWDELDIERKKRILHEASAAGKLGKTKEDERGPGTPRPPRSAGFTRASSTKLPISL